MNAMTLYANDLILFAHIVDAGSFTKAAEQTGLPKSTLSRRLTDLENEFGERLMQRSTRRLVLTDFGERILEHARRLQEETEAATALVLHRQATPHGTLRVSLPPEFRALSMVEILTSFTQSYPDVRLELDLSSRRVDLVAERFDLAVRIASRLPDDNALVARHLATFHNGLYASPAYLQRHGTPQHPSELMEHTGLVLVTSGGDQQHWLLANGDQRWEGLPSRTLAANSMGLHQALAEKGLGIVGLSEQFALPLVKQQALQRVLPDWDLPPTPVWCVTPGRRLLPQRTLVFIDMLKAALGPETK